MMNLKKTYIFRGTIASAKGLWRDRVVGKKVVGLITVTGPTESFATAISRVFLVGMSITDIPMRNLFPGADLPETEYAYVLRRLTVTDAIETPSSEIGLSLTVVPWRKIENIKATVSPKWMIRKFLLDEVVIEGEASFLKSEEIKSKKVLEK